MFPDIKQRFSSPVNICTDKSEVYCKIKMSQGWVHSPPLIYMKKMTEMINSKIYCCATAIDYTAEWETRHLNIRTLALLLWSYQHTDLLAVIFPPSSPSILFMVSTHKSDRWSSTSLPAPFDELVCTRQSSLSCCGSLCRGKGPPLSLQAGSRWPLYWAFFNLLSFPSLFPRGTSGAAKQ